MLKINSYYLLVLSALFFNSTNVLWSSTNSLNSSWRSQNNVKLINEKLKDYYKSRGKNYFDTNNVGKFSSYCDCHGYNDLHITKELCGDTPSLNKRSIVDFDTKFPLPKECQNENRREIVFQILKNIMNKKALLKGVLPMPICGLDECLENEAKDEKKLTLSFFGYLRKQQTKLGKLIPIDVQKYILKYYNLGYLPCSHAEDIWFETCEGLGDSTEERKCQIIIELSAYYNILEAQKNGETALVKAVKYSHIKIAECLLQQGANANVEFISDMSILSYACENDNIEMVKTLLQHGASVNAADSKGMTALLLASQDGDTYVLKTLLQYGSNVNAANKEGMTALLFASQNGDTYALKTLLQHGANVNAANKEGVTALLLASQNGDTYALKTLLQYRASVNAADSKGMTALLLASQNLDTYALKTLLQHGANVNAADSKGVTALLLASQNRGTHALKALLQHGADVNAADSKGMTALLWASQNGDTYGLETLLQYGANVNTADSKGMTALLWASQNGDTYGLKTVLQYRANVNAKNEKGMTALLWASKNGDGKMISELFEYGVNFQKKDLENALKSAVEAKLVDIIPLLIVPLLKSKIKKQGQKPIVLIDQMLGEYYDYRTASTYFDDDGKGKFLNYCDKNGFDDNDVEEELGPNSYESLLAKFDENFPCYAFIKDGDEKKKYIFDILKNACKKMPSNFFQRIS